MQIEYQILDKFEVSLLNNTEEMAISRKNTIKAIKLINRAS